MKKRVWLHIACWAGLYVFWIVLFRNHTLVFTRTLTVQLCYLLFIAANYYWQVLVAIPRFLYRKKYAAFVLALAGGIVISALLRVPLATYLQEHVFAPPGQPAGFGTLFGESLLNISFWVIGMTGIRLFIEKIRFRQYIDAMEKERTRNELDFLKAQFNPHFLFNSINSIYGHIDRRNDKARNMLLSFSEMLRYQLYECNVDNISLDKEINYIRNYVALQKVRKEENVQVCLNIPDNIRGVMIAPLLFVAFIENAFKYVSTREDGENKVEISLEKKDGVLFFRTFNTRDPKGRERNGMDQGGIGVANVKRRLELQYPGKFELLTRDGEDAYEILLQLEV